MLAVMVEVGVGLSAGLYLGWVGLAMVSPPTSTCTKSNMMMSFGMNMWIHMRIHAMKKMGMNRMLKMPIKMTMPITD